MIDIETHILPQKLQSAVRAKMREYYDDDMIDTFANEYSAFVAHESSYVISQVLLMLTTDIPWDSHIIQGIG